MSLVVPASRIIEILTTFLTPDLELRLFSNDVTPDSETEAGDLTQVAGGGYTPKTLEFANWDIVTGDPVIALYDTVQSFVFTGATDAPATIYGYYIVDPLTGLLKWAERFPDANVPFEPVDGSNIRITPRITGQSIV